MSGENAGNFGDMGIPTPPNTPTKENHENIRVNISAAVELINAEQDVDKQHVGSLNNATSGELKKYKYTNLCILNDAT